MWILRRVFPSMIILGFLTACGSDVAAPTFEDISGTYTGQMSGISQGVALSALFSVTLTQNQGELSGSWALQGVLSDDFGSAPTQGTGPLTGTIGSGNNPSVNVTVRTGSCPNYSAPFSGTYDSANRRLTITGPVEILTETCAVLLTYSAVMVLVR